MQHKAEVVMSLDAMQELSLDAMQHMSFNAILLQCTHSTHWCVSPFAFF